MVSEVVPSLKESEVSVLTSPLRIICMHACKHACRHACMRACIHVRPEEGPGDDRRLPKDDLEDLQLPNDELPNADPNPEDTQLPDDDMGDGTQPNDVDDDWGDAQLPHPNDTRLPQKRQRRE